MLKGMFKFIMHLLYYMGNLKLNKTRKRKISLQMMLQQCIHNNSDNVISLITKVKIFVICFSLSTEVL